jgi:hypothetical protein
VVALTTQHRIEGTLAPDPQLYIPNSNDYWSPLCLTQARVAPLDPAGAGERAGRQGVTPPLMHVRGVSHD